MFYLISHNKASLWTAINCVWIFPLRRNRELSERAPVPQAAFILMQRSIAIFIAGSITHVTVVLWLGPLHRKKPDNITAEVCKTIQLWYEEGGERWRAAGGFRRQEGWILILLLSHTCTRTYLSSLQLWEPLVYRLVWLSQTESIKKTTGCRQRLLLGIWVTMWMQNVPPLPLLVSVFTYSMFGYFLVATQSYLRNSSKGATRLFDLYISFKSIYYYTICIQRFLLDFRNISSRHFII